VIYYVAYTIKGAGWITGTEINCEEEARSEEQEEGR
jgi:hypothetical protein